MSARYLLEGSATDGYLLEDGTGVLLLEQAAVPTPGVGALTLTGLAPTMAASTALPAYVTRRRRSRRGVAAWL